MKAVWPRRSQRVLQRIALEDKLGPEGVNVVDGYVWRLSKSAPVNPDAEQTDSGSQAIAPTDSAFVPLAARQLILGLSRERNAEELVQLDAMHQIAKTTQIVTPYSSMIVLVNDQQREALKQAERQDDRFDREVESGNEELTQPHNPLNTAVPEPSSVGAIVLGTILLLYWRRRRAS